MNRMSAGRPLGRNARHFLSTRSIHVESAPAQPTLSHAHMRSGSSRPIVRPNNLHSGRGAAGEERSE